MFLVLGIQSEPEMNIFALAEFTFFWGGGRGTINKKRIKCLECQMPVCAMEKKKVEEEEDQGWRGRKPPCGGLAMREGLASWALQVLE